MKELESRADRALTESLQGYLTEQQIRELLIDAELTLAYLESQREAA